MCVRGLAGRERERDWSILQTSGAAPVSMVSRTSGCHPGKGGRRGKGREDELHGDNWSSETGAVGRSREQSFRRGEYLSLSIRITPLRHSDRRVATFRTRSLATQLPRYEDPKPPQARGASSPQPTEPAGAPTPTPTPTPTNICTRARLEGSPDCGAPLLALL